MASEKRKHKTEDEGDQLKGTLYSVFGLGIFIIATWLVVFSIFAGRF
ncbi:hypothetical protein NLX67_12230 [Domibacillus sp. A3M-37]|nr:MULTISPECIES: hypothetical protein [Domibacillus]MCP3763150.1 hypothetical protein [Domibacillus sp. A3M-37]